LKVLDELTGQVQLLPVRDLDILFRTAFIDARDLSIEQRIDLMKQVSREHLAAIAREYEISENEAYRLIKIYRSLGRRFSRCATAHLVARP
jgi:hypothetical protein